MDILSVLTVIFIILKVLNYIDWSWWWVISPTIVEICIFSFIMYIGKKILDKIVWGLERKNIMKKLFVLSLIALALVACKAEVKDKTAVQGQNSSVKK